ncbi:MAG TPA: hypothetical protein VFZ62_04430 [Candidatus Saccharimonadales bacterium]
MKYLKTDKMYCFSPPVMIATFAIEIALAVYTIWRYKLTPVTRLAALILVGLATFQLAEYNVCEGAWGVDSLTWAKIGYVAITLLPPLGVHLATKLAGQSQPLLVGAGYLSGALFSLFFLFVGNGIESQQCLGNYVIFKTAPWSIIPYTIYYYGWLFLTVGYAWKAAKAMKKESKRTALYALAVGYLAFIVPTTAANIVDPSTIAGIPSIMCGFAVLLALSLALVVLPNYFKNEKK